MNVGIGRQWALHFSSAMKEKPHSRWACRFFFSSAYELLLIALENAQLAAMTTLKKYCLVTENLLSQIVL